MSSETKEDIEEFSGIEQPPLLDQIKRILDEYRNDVQIIKELIQNADDAEASSMEILYEGRSINEEQENEAEYRKFLRAPALVFFNDAKFTDDDWRGIRSIYTSVKRDDPLKIGRFGLGFKSVFHLTDYPCIISGNNAMFINPHAREFGKICTTVKLNRLKEWHRLNYEDLLDSLNGTLGFSEHTLTTGIFEGTLFWFPLRQVASPLSDNIYTDEKVSHLLQAFLNESSRSLLFLKTLCSIKLFIDVEQNSSSSSGGSSLDLRHMSLGKETECFSVAVSNVSEDLPKVRKAFLQELKETGNEVPDQSRHWVFHITIESMSKSVSEDIKVAKSRWLIVNYLKGGELSERTRTLMKDKDLGYPHVVGLAAPLSKEGEYSSTAGHVFCYQPLPQENVHMTGLPVHINGFFALSQNRRQVRWPDQGDPTSGDGDKKIEWNIALRSEILPEAYEKLIMEVADLCQTEQNQKYLLEATFNTIPDLTAVDEHWLDLASQVVRLCKDRKILYTEQDGGKWIKAEEAVFTTFHNYHGYSTFQKTVYDLLFADKLNLVTVPQHVMDALEGECPSLKYTTPAFVKSHLAVHGAYKALNKDQKQDILEFVFQDCSRTGLENLEILPLEDGTFNTFDPGKHIIFESQEVIDLFPGKEANFVCSRLRPRTREILTELLEEETLCLRQLTDNTAAEMIKGILNENFFPVKETLVCNVDIEKWRTWIRNTWNLIQNRFRKSIHLFTDVPLFPLVSDSKWENVNEFSLLKLTSPLLYLPSFSEFEDKEIVERSFRLLSVVIIERVPENFDIEVVRPFLYEETSESIVELLDRIDKTQIDHYNEESSDESSKTFLKYLSERIHTKIAKSAHENLRHLRIFRGYSTVSESRLVSLTQINDIYEKADFPVKFPKQMILLTSETEKRFSMQLEANVVSEFELIRFTLRNIAEYDNIEKRNLVHWIITSGNHFSYNDIQESLREIDFLEARDGVFHKVGELFDPSCRELCDLFGNMPVFPNIDAETEQLYLSGLRALGLKTLKELRISDIEVVSSKVHEMALGNETLDKTACLALLNILNENEHLVEKSKLYNKRCILITDTLREENSELIPLKNRDISSSGLLLRPSEIKSFKHVHLIGSVKYMIDSKNLQTLSRIFDWDTAPEVQCVVEHLFNIIQNYKLEYKSKGLLVIESIYNFLSDTGACSKEEVKEAITKQFIAPCDAFVWDGNSFQPLCNVYAESVKGDVDMRPFLYPLPDEIHHLADFFINLGCRKRIEFDMYVSTLEQIKDSEHLTDDDENIAESYTEMAISILNKIKKSFLHELSDKKRQLYFPTVKETGGVRMMPAEFCTYCDEQWLLNMDFQLDDDIHYVHPELPLATAEALGVPSLRQQMMSDTEAFEEWGQEEPLTRRLRNLLKEGYVDGVSFAKELFQNADDAGANKLWILFDERENNNARSQLISEGMAECQGPAVWVFNDERFTEADFKNITKLSGATKEDDSTKIGKFGLGFCAVYNITDVPSFISGENFIIFDPDMSHLGKVLPGRSPGLRINFRIMKNLKMMKGLKNQFLPFENLFGCKIIESSSPFFSGTLFRLPLRNKASEISDIVYSSSEMKCLFGKIMSMAANMLLFNQNVSEVKLFHLPKSEQSPSNARLLYKVNKETIRMLPAADSITAVSSVLVEASRRKQTETLRDNPVQVIDQVTVEIANYVGPKFQVLTDRIDRRMAWLVSWATGTDETSLKLTFEEKGALPLGAVAIPIHTRTNNGVNELKVVPFRCVSEQFYQKGHLFFFLPLPIQHCFPFHINGQFTVTTDRRQLRSSSEDDINVKLKNWNKCLLDDSIPKALLYLLTNLHYLGSLTEYKFDSLWPKHEAAETLECLPSAFYREVTKPELHSVFEKDGQWFDISKCVFIEKKLRSSVLGDTVFEMLSLLTELVVDVSEEVYDLLYQADQSLMDTKTVSEESFFLDYFLPHLEEISSDSCMSDKWKQLLYRAIDLQNKSIDHWLKGNKCIPSQPNGILKKPDGLVDTDSSLAALFIPTDGYFPDIPFTERNVLDKLKLLGLMDRVLKDSLVVERATSVEKLSKRCSLCALERSGKMLVYLTENISKHNLVLSEIQCTRFIPVRTKPKDWPFEWHADIFSSSKVSKKCKTHRKTPAENRPSYFDRPSNIYFSKCKNIIGCIAFVFDENTYLTYGAMNRSIDLKNMLNNLGMNGTKTEDVNVSFVLEQLEIISRSFATISKRIAYSEVQYIILDIYRHLDRACKSEEVYSFVAQETRDKSVVLVRDGFVPPKTVSKYCCTGCKPYLYNLEESPLKEFATLCKCLEIRDHFPPYQVAMVLQKKQQDMGDAPLSQSEIHTIINILSCLKKCIERSHMKTDDVQSIVTDELNAIYGPDETGILRDCTAMCFNDFDGIEKSESMIYAHESFPPNLAKFFGVKPKIIHNLEESSEDFEDFYQDEPLVVRLNRLVEGYPCDSGIFKELMQNADDAQASEIHFIKDYTTHPCKNVIDSRFEALQGPALVVYNDTAFSNDDLAGIQRLGRGSKADDPSQTGRYGVGFNAVYNLTDAPSFYTRGGDIQNGETLCVFDPLAKYIPNVTRKKPGKRYKNLTAIRSLHSDMMSGYHENFLIKNEKGTIFRFPLRTEHMAETSEIKREVTDIEKLSILLKDFADEIGDILLFLKHLKSVKISTYKDSNFIEDVCIYVTMDSVQAEIRGNFVKKQKQMSEEFKRQKHNIFKFEQYTSLYELSMNVQTSSKEKARFDYIIVQTLGFEKDKPVSETVKDALTNGKIGLLPHGGIALRKSQKPLSENVLWEDEQNCKAFCFLPLPIKTGLPVQVHGYFALDHETRRSLWMSENFEKCYRCLWNRVLIEQVISTSYVFLLEYTKSKQFQGITNVITSEAVVSRLLWNYQTLFPLKENMTDYYWKHLLRSIYRRLVAESIDFLPVQSILTNTFNCQKAVRLTWTSLNVTGSHFPAYINKESIKTGDSASHFNNILRRIGMRIVHVPNGIKEALDFAEVGISFLEPQHVIQFICSTYEQETSEQKDCRIETEKNVVKTALQTVDDADHILEYCLRDLKCFETNFEKIPLMVTQDSIVRRVPSNGFFFVEKQSRFTNFFPSKLQHFVHSDVAKTITFSLIKSSVLPKKLKVFNLLHFVELVKDTNQIEHNNVSAKVWDKKIPPENWIGLFWDFFYYQFSNGKHKMSQLLEVVQHLPVIPVIKPLSDEVMILPPSQRESVIDRSSFSTKRDLHTALKELNLPEIAHSFFSAEFMSACFKSLIEEVPNFKTPLKILQCLHLNSSELELIKLQDECVHEVLWYLNDCLPESVSAEDIAKLKDIPLFLSHFGKRVMLNRYRTIRVVPVILPKDGLEILAERERLLFLRNTGHKKLIKLLDLGEASLAQVYTQYIIPQQHLLSRTWFYCHLDILSRYELFEAQGYKALLALLKNTQFVEARNGLKLCVSAFFDPIHEVFKRLCNETELVPDCLRKPNILKLFRKIGLRSEMTIQLFERFAKDIESRWKKESLSQKVQEDSVLLTTHLLCMSEEFFGAENLECIARVNFVKPYIVDEKLSAIKEQSNSRNLMCFADAVVISSRRISWTVSNILPEYADPSINGISQLKMDKLKISEKPSFTKLIHHCENIGSNLESMLKRQNNISHEELEKVMHELYAALCANLSSEQGGCDSLKTLENVPIVYFPDIKIITPATQVTITCKEGEAIPPYLLPCPESYLQYRKLFLCLGAVEQPSSNSYARVLHMLKKETEDEELNPQEQAVAVKATGHFYKYLVEEKGTAEIEDGHLFLLSCKSTLVHARSLVVRNNAFFQKQLDRSETVPYVYHFGLDKLREFRLKSEDCIESLKYLPENCRPFLLTEVVKEKVILKNIEHKDKTLSSAFENYLSCNDFRLGFLRLVKHVWKSENRDWKEENDEATISNSLQKIEFVHCSGIETKLALRRIEDGKLRSELLVENTNSRKFSHIEETEKSVCIFFDSADQEWRRNVIKHLAVHLNNIADQSLKGEHFVTLMEILSMYEKSEDVNLHLSRAGIEEYTFHTTLLDDRPSYPVPGEIVPKKYHKFLDNEFVIFEHDFKFVALELDDPALNIDADNDDNITDNDTDDGDGENDDEIGKHMEQTFIFVHIIKKIGPEHELPLFQEYEIDCGSESTVIVKASQLYKFIRKSKSSNVEQMQLVVYERNNGQENGPQNYRRQEQSMKEVRCEIRKYLREAWKKGEQEKRGIIKRLLLKWHPDKNPDNVQFTTKVFQYIQQCLYRLEKGLDLPDDDEDNEESKNSSFSSGANSSHFWFNRYWSRYKRGQQYNERRYKNYWSGFRDSSGNCRYNNFSDAWSSRHNRSRSEYEPYHWYSRARLWFTQAEFDIRNARASFLSTPQFNWVCFSAHQAAEKAFKAVWYAKDANKVDSSILSSHNLEYIASGVSLEAQALAQRLTSLTGRHDNMLYPSREFCRIPAESFNKRTAESVIEMAQKILELCSSHVKQG